MSGFGILMVIFAICLFAVGLYMYTGHKLKMLKWKAAFKKTTIAEWKNIGKYTIYTSIFVLYLGIIAIIFGF